MDYETKKSLILQRMKQGEGLFKFDINTADRYELDDSAGPDVNNSHYFCYFSFKNQETLFYRSARRGGDAKDEVWLVFRDKSGNVYMASKDHYSHEEGNPTTITCIEPEKVMKFEYHGFVRKAVLTKNGYAINDNLPLLSAKMVATFYGKTQIFEFTRDLDPEVTAGCIAREEDISNVQNAFKAIHQVHYEQGGLCDLEIEIDGVKSSVKDGPSMRDHSYGRRVWDFFDRYIWNIILTEKGDLIHNSWMQYPVLKELQAGFDLSPTKFLSLRETTKMDDVPCVGTTPKEWTVVTTYKDGSKHTITGRPDFVVPFLFEDDFLVNEGVCEYLIDGKIRGRGIGEFSFNANKNRWKR